MTGPVPMCRNCLRGVWRMTPRGQIKRNTSGECSKAGALQSMALRVVMSPALELLAAKRAIWPESKAHRCPLYELKPAAVAAAADASAPRPAAAGNTADQAGVCADAPSVRRHTLKG